MMSLAKIINDIFYLYFLLMLIRIFLTWIPSIDWYRQPYKFLKMAVDPYLDIFRRFIPPISGIDFSPIIAFIVLQLLNGVVVGLVAGLAG